MFKLSLRLLTPIFLLALILRWLYFPDNIYIGFDQARDLTVAQEILQGHLKVLGPPSAASDKLFPGPLVYYVHAAVFFLFGPSPLATAIFYKIYQALGVVLVFLIGKIIFEKKIGLLAALFYGISYEQSQYSLFLSHQPLAILPVLVFYWGLSKLIFEKDQRGLIIALGGLGLAIQFHYVFILLLPILLLIVIFHRPHQLKFKNIFLAGVIFLLAISTYIIAEIKFGFRFTSTILSIGQHSSKIYPEWVLFTINRFFHDNILADYKITPLIALLFLGALIYFFVQKQYKEKIIFLMLWFAGGLIPYLLAGTPSYYYSVGAPVSLLIFTSFLIWKISDKNLALTLMISFLIIGSNLYQIINLNKFGPNKDFIIQPGMLLTDQIKVLDYTYEKSKGENFAVNGLTIPLNVNTTWSYLFEWYGENKYNYLPVWAGAAAGFPGNLKIETNRSNLPKIRFTIIEPTVGIGESQIEDFFKEENYFTKVVEEKHFGTLTVQLREPY
ncbi:MAG: glycosyltransferase family 39 protein [Candidatus Daviesbacteria bacterium]|nr:MAG: glycosyltransferase family 39 protein [Candidatus Daviesbacteria bacterium]